MKRWTKKQMATMDDVQFAIAILNERKDGLSNPLAPLTQKLASAIDTLRKLGQSPHPQSDEVYTAAHRTNYFHVKDPAAFLKMMDMYGYSLENNTIMKASTSRFDKKTAGALFAFGDTTPLHVDQYKDGQDLGNICDRLQEHLADDDAIIISEAGRMFLHYVVTGCTLITKTSIQRVDAQAIAIEKAKEFLGATWETLPDF